MYEGPMDMDNGVGIDYGSGVKVTKRGKCIIVYAIIYHICDSINNNTIF